MLIEVVSILGHGVDASGRQVIEARVRRVPIIDGIECGCRLRQDIASLSNAQPVRVLQPPSPACNASLRA
jgi:hypothetical protein